MICLSCEKPLQDKSRFCTGCGKPAPTVQQHLDLALAGLNMGRAIFLYDTVFVPVDSLIDDVPLDRFDIERLVQRGLKGWEVVGTVSKTSARTLHNRNLGTGLETYAGAIGGNVDGAYVLLKKELKAPLSPIDEEELNEYCRLRVGDNM